MADSNNSSKKIDYKNRDKFLKDYDSLYEELSEILIALVFPTGNIFKKSQIQQSKYTLRDSIIYRAGSVRFHLELLLFIKGSIEKEFITNLKKINEPFLMIQGTENTLQIFDDIVFHICSMYDYLGNLIGLLYFGEDKMKLKWRGVINSIKDPNNKLSVTSIAPLINKIHKEWVDPLFNYRGRLIHHKKDYASAKQRVSFNNDFINVKFDVGIPKMLKNILKIKNLEKSDEEFNEEVDIIKIALDISEKSVERVVRILGSLTKIK